MARIPESSHSTVRRIYQLHEQRRENEQERSYLGASELGESCARRLWYRLRWAAVPQFEGRILRLFESGHREEARLVDELRAIGVRVEGQQHEVVFADGHGKGHLDGALLGLEEGPKTWAVFECKTANAKTFKEVTAKGVKAANPRHYAQVQMYMGLTGMTRAAYFVVNKDTDEISHERIEFDKEAFTALVRRAEGIVSAAEPPVRVSDDPAWYGCRFCPFREVCHGVIVPNATCRSCAHSTPVASGAWKCEKFDAEIPEDAQREGCDEHRFIPVLLEHVAELVDVSDERVRWRNKLTGKTFDQPGYTSRELAAAKDFRVIGDDFAEELKAVFGEGTRVTGSRPLDQGECELRSDLEPIYGASEAWEEGRE